MKKLTLNCLTGEQTLNTMSEKEIESLKQTAIENIINEIYLETENLIKITTEKETAESLLADNIIEESIVERYNNNITKIKETITNLKEELAGLKDEK